MTRKHPRFAPLFVALFLLIAGIAIARADVVIGVTTDFIPADGDRDYMDIGGVWNGTTEVESDTFSVTYSNTGNETAYDFSVMATLPDGLDYANDSASVDTNPAADPSVTFTAVQNGNLLTFDTFGYDLPAGASITFVFGLTADIHVVPGTLSITYDHSYALTDGGDPVETTPGNQSVVARTGDVTVNITPKQQIRAVGETATFIVTVTNTGLGGLFDLTIDESALHLPQSNLGFLSMEQQLPADLDAAASGGGAIFTLPYLAPGEIFSAEVEAVVLACGLIENVVSSGHRVAGAITESSVPVQIDFRQPIVDYTAPAIPLAYNEPFHVEIPLPNTGLGDARAFELHTTLDELEVTITNVGGGFSYDPSNGVFTYDENGGTIANRDVDTVLTFDIQAANVCNHSGGGPVSYTAKYTNACGDPYEIPRKFGSVSAAEDAPSIQLSMEVSQNRIAVAQAASYTVNLSASHRENIEDDFVDVLITLPVGIRYNEGSPGTGNVTVNGQELVWSVSVDDLVADQTLQIDFEVDSAPCLAGTILNATATTDFGDPVRSNHGCDLTASAGATFLVSNNPGFSASQYFEVTPGDDGTQFLTGDATGSRQGERIGFTATYSFGEYYPGTWTGSVYEDTFNGMSEMTLVDGTLTVTGTFGTELVPAGAITELSSGFEIDLGFLSEHSGFFPADEVGGRTITIKYQTTATDDAIATGASTAVAPHLNNLYLAGTDEGSLGICDEEAQDRFTQGVFYTLVRPAASIGLGMANGRIDVCAPEELTITVDNATVKEAENLRVTFFTDGADFTYDTGFAPQYGGAFSTGTITYSENGGNNPTFTFTGGALSEEGTITVRVWATTNEMTHPLTAKVEYDTWQTADEGNRVFESDASYVPSVVHKANLAVRVTPESITVTDSKIRYLTYITNTDAGAAYGTQLTNTLPLGIILDRGATNAANAAAYALDETDVLTFGAQERIVWDLGAIPSGETVQITLVGTVGDVEDCEIPTAGDEIVVTWGCGDSAFQTKTLDSPKFRFPSGQMQILHDTRDSFASLCEEGLIVILLKNTGPTNIQDVTINEIIPATTGISIHDTVRYSVNGGPLKEVVKQPTQVGDTYTFTKEEIVELEEIVPLGVEGTNSIRIEIPIVTDDVLFAGQPSPSLNVSAIGRISCGLAVAFPPIGSEGKVFNIPLQRPTIHLTKTGRNIDAGQTNFTDTVYGGAGDVIEWRIEVENTGTADAEYLFLTDALSGSKSTGSTISGGTLDEVPVFAGTPVELDGLPKGESQVYFITETLGEECVTLTREASAAWGCAEDTLVSAPGNSTDSATIEMSPDIADGTNIDQSITYLSGGRARIVVTLTNTGGNAYDLVVTNTFPNSQMALDVTEPPALSGHVATYYPTLNSSIDGIDVKITDPLAPVFEFTSASAGPMLRYGDQVKLTYYVRPTVFDTATATEFPDLAKPENAGLDPTPPATGDNIVKVEYKSSCGGDGDLSTDTLPINLLTPDLDIISIPAATVLAPGADPANYDFGIRNVGEPGSIADHITVVARVGKGWTGAPAPTLANNGAPIGGLGTPVSIERDDHMEYTYTLPAGYLLTRPASGHSPTLRVRLNAAPSDNGEPLLYRIEVYGESRPEDGSATGDYYSQDHGGSRVIGVALTKDIASTSEPTSAETLPSTADVLVGEEITYRIGFRFFGGDADNAVTDIILRDTHGDTDNNPHLGLGFVNHANVTGLVPTSVTTPVAAVGSPSGIADARVSFNFNTGSGVDAFFETDSTVRVLNLPESEAGALMRNNLSLRFNYLGAVYRSDNAADDGFSGGTAFASGLSAFRDVTLIRPAPAIKKRVRNLGPHGDADTTFGPTAEGEAGDILEYQLVISNPEANAGPLFSIFVEDEVPDKLVVDGDSTTGTVNEENEILFNAATTAIHDPGSDFDRLDGGGSIELTYRATLAQAVNPSEILVNSATVTGYTLPAPSGEQTAPAGDPGEYNGAGILTAEDTASVSVTAIEQSKTLAASSVSESNDATVLVGEQIRYLITLTLPLGTAPNLSVTDTLPEGLAFVGTPTVEIGTDIATDFDEASDFSYAQGDRLLTWSFGETIANGDNRIITIEYVAQVENVASNEAGTSLINEATYNFTNLPKDSIDFPRLTVTVAEPNVTVTHEVRNVTRDTDFDETAPADAGDILEYRVALTNPASTYTSHAYDLRFESTLPAGLTYVAESTAVVTDTGLSGTLGEPDLAGPILTWGRTQNPPVDLDLAPGTDNFEFTYRVTVDDSSAPLQVYTNALVADWTSLDGAPGANLGTALATPGQTLGERTGTGTTPNTYQSSLETTVTALNATTIAKSKAGDTLPHATEDDGFRVGDLVTYTLTIPVQEGTLANFSVNDELPQGLAFQATDSISPAVGEAGFTYTAPDPDADTAPHPGDTGSIAWQFDTLLNAGDNDDANDSLVITYLARVVDPAGIDVAPANQTLVNKATVSFTVADGDLHTTGESVATIVVRQPQLTLAKEVISPGIDALGNYVRRPGDTAEFQLTLANEGTAPAYNIHLTDTLPEGLRATAPELTAATLNGKDKRVELSAASAWNDADGKWTFDLGDDELLLPDETLVLTYTVTVDDDDDLKGDTLENTATVDAFYSLPSADDPENNIRRKYDAFDPATAALVIGLRIDGSVYHDLEPDGLKNNGENWSSLTGPLKVPVYVNLVADGGIVFRTVPIEPDAATIDDDFEGTTDTVGRYYFDYLPPGNFNLILTDAEGSVVARRPANWLNREPANGLLDVILVAEDLTDRNFGLNQGDYALGEAPAISKEAAGETLPEAGPGVAFRIGDLVTYTLDIFPHEGTNTSFTVTDTLPDGLAFHDTVSIEQLADPSRYTYTTPADANAPAAGDEGEIVWDFGTFTNAIADPANNTLRIEYRARVIDTGEEPLAAPGPAPEETSDGPLTNSAALAYANEAVSHDPIAAGPVTTDITVEQPRLEIAKVRSSPEAPENLVPPGGTGTFTVTVTNTGTAPAYNVRITDTFPNGLGKTEPELRTATLNGDDSLAELKAVATWDDEDGTYVFDLGDTQALLPGEELILTYRFTVDDDATRAATLSNEARVDQYFSKPSSDPSHRRQYAPTETVGADVIVGIEISGTVYEDLDESDTLNSAEDWSGPAKPTVYVNLLDGDGLLYASATVDPGLGTYSFTNLPAGDYTLVFATTESATESDRPANWLYRTPANGVIVLTATDDDALEQNFGLFQDTLAAAVMTKTVSGATLPLDGPDGGFRIGDLVTYTIDMEPQEGLFTDFVVTDALPEGLAFVETLSIGQVDGPDRYTYVEPADDDEPTEGATGDLTWDFGDFENALLGPDDNILRIVYTARVLDAAGVEAPAPNPAGTTTDRINSARLDYVNEEEKELFAGPASAEINIEQPRLVIEKDRLAPAAENIMMPGETARFRLTVTNTGSAPAYNIVVADELSEGMRNATPVLDKATLNGDDVTDTVAAPVYTSGSGEWILTLTDDEILLPNDATLVLEYTVTVDADAQKGSVLTNTALVASYASKPSSDGEPRRMYAPTDPATQNLIVGMRIDGSVYHQLIPNGEKDDSEDWTSGETVFVNLVTNEAVSLDGFDLAADRVLRSAEVEPGTGEFSFTEVPPGNYRIIITDTDLAGDPIVPDTWTFDTPATGSITPVVMTDADLDEQHLGLYQGRVVSGQIYYDLAAYGVKEAGEDWTAGSDLVVNLVDIFHAPIVRESLTIVGGSEGVYAFTNVPPGDYRLVVAPAGQNTAVTAAPPEDLVFVAPTNGTRDELTVALDDLEDQDFGLTPGRTVSGFVYNDINPNGQKDGFEDWTLGPALVVNLVKLSDGTVFASAEISPGGEGAYAFTDVPPGSFRIIVTNAAGSTAVAAPATWLFRSPPDGAILIDVAAANFENRNFGLFRGRTVSGVVFRDTGDGGVANDGVRDDGEPGIGNVRVRLLDDANGALATTFTDGGGGFSLTIPAETEPGATLHVEAFNPPAHLSTGGRPGSAGGTYDRVADRITFAFPDEDVTGLEFGDVPANAFITDGAQTILPGATAFYRHTFVAGTAGEVVFTTSGSAHPSIPWSAVLFRDLNGNGTPDAGEPVVTDEVLSVVAGEKIELVLKETAPAGASYGAMKTTVVTASFSYTNATPALEAHDTRQDVTTIGDTRDAGLQLTKAVDETTALPGQKITYTITYQNVGTEPLTNLIINDRTPHYTVFVSAAPDTADSLPDSLTDVRLEAPEPDATGPIQWTFTGALDPGASGTVTFSVRLLKLNE